MLVKDLIDKINSKEMTVKKIADHYNINKNTVGGKLKDLGYKWNSKTQKHEYIGENPEPLDVDFSTLLKKQNTSKKEQKPEVIELLVNERKEQKPEVIELKIIESEKRKEPFYNASYKVAEQNQKNSEYDIIDVLLNSKSKAKKVYKGIYFDSDVASIIDSVDKKSELVNQIVRKAFADRGLL